LHIIQKIKHRIFVCSSTVSKFHPKIIVVLPKAIPLFTILCLSTFPLLF